MRKAHYCQYLRKINFGLEIRCFASPTLLTIARLSRAPFFSRILGRKRVIDFVRDAQALALSTFDDQHP